MLSNRGNQMFNTSRTVAIIAFVGTIAFYWKVVKPLVDLIPSVD